MYIDQTSQEGVLFNLVYIGNNMYQVLEGNKPTDIRFTASTQAEASSKFQAIMNTYR